MEAATDWHALPVLRSFRKERETRITAWSVPPVGIQKLVVPLQEKRAKKVQADLAKWKRKLALTKTKVSKLTRRVRYYQNVRKSS